MKKFLKGLALFSIGLVLVTGCGKEEPKEEHKNLEPDSAVISEQTIEGLQISKLSIVYENNVSKMVANVTNTNETDYSLRVISIKLYDDEDNLLVDTTGYIGNVLKPNETKQLIVDVTKDLRDATKVQYKIVKE